MGILIDITLWGWIPVVLTLFSILPARRAVIVAYLVAWLFLPVAGYDLPGFTNYNKTTATTVGVLLGALIFDADRLRSFRPSLLDVPMLVFCVSPLFSSLGNDLGLYDGLSAALYKTLTWGLPWLTGRLYFGSLEGIREFGLAMVLGGLVYVPLCWWEIRMSPQLHIDVYGFIQHGFEQTRRGGGFRPMVFMHHGLMLGMFMACSALTAVQFWISGVRRDLFGVPMWSIAAVLVVTAVMCKSTGATLLMCAAIAGLLVMRRWKTALPVVLMLVIPVVWLSTRATGLWDGNEAIEVARLISEDRAGSLQFRIDAENRLSEHALNRPFLGWGAWGRNFVPEEPGSDRMVIADGLWILTLGTQGLLGLIALYVAGLLPLFAFARRYHPRHWHERSLGAAAVFALIVGLFMIDNLVNDMFNPLYVLAAGGVIGCSLRRKPFVKQTSRHRIRVTLPVRSA